MSGDEQQLLLGLGQLLRGLEHSQTMLAESTALLAETMAMRRAAAEALTARRDRRVDRDRRADRRAAEDSARAILAARADRRGPQLVMPSGSQLPLPSSALGSFVSAVPRAKSVSSGSQLMMPSSDPGSLVSPAPISKSVRRTPSGKFCATYRLVHPLPKRRRVDETPAADSTSVLGTGGDHVLSKSVT
jgi:hypothetical protein